MHQINTNDLEMYWLQLARPNNSTYLDDKNEQNKKLSATF